jgi:ribonuclease HII
MAWQIGIDEAGYGPNLGPFVMTLVACRVPDKLHRSCLWKMLKKRIRRADEEADGRLVVADSKLVYAPASGWCDLEIGALAAHAGGFFAATADLHGLLTDLADGDVPALRGESWFVGDTALPTEVERYALDEAIDNWRTVSTAADVSWGFCRSVIVPAPRFNDLIDKWDSKSAVLSVAATQLMQQCVKHTAAEPMRFVIDKHGGRNAYSALLQEAFCDGMVFAEEEGRLRSVYRVEGLDRSVQIVVTPKADVENFTVSLASMISKYVRELLMREFNRFWKTHLPELKPTAGYPSDASRYFDEIRPVLTKLGIAERAVWRCR